MDAKTAACLARIIKANPYQDSIMETVKDDGELLEKMSWVAKKTGNKALTDMCAMGLFTAPDRQEVKAVMAAASEEWLEGQIKAAIAHGQMTPPTLKEADEFTNGIER